LYFGIALIFIRYTNHHLPVRKATISLSLPLTVLISNVRLKTVYPQTVLIRYLMIVRLGNRYWVHR